MRFARIRLTAFLLSVFVSLPALAAPPAEDVLNAANFFQRLTVRGIVSGVTVDGTTVTVHGLAPLAGADDGSLADVARAAINAQGWDDADVLILGPSGQFIARFSRSTGLSRS